MRPALETLAGENEVRGSIHFLGHLAPEALPHSLLDVSVLASVDEGFPNSLLEAMAQGVPVVSTRVGGVPDLVDHGRNGLLVESGDAAMLSAALIDVLSQRLDVDALRAGGRGTTEGHREDHVIDELLELYRKLSGCRSRCLQ